MTPEELQRWYGLEAASRARLEQANKMLKDNTETMTVGAAVQEYVKTQDPAALAAVAESLGMPAEMFNEMSAEDQAAATQAAQAATGTPAPEQGKKLGWDDFTPEMQQYLGQITRLAAANTKAENATTLDDIHGKVKNTLRSDEYFKTITDEGLLKKANAYINNEVQRRVVVLGERWPDVLESIVPEARSLFQGIGNQQGAGYPGSGIGPAATLPPAQVKPLPLEDVSANDPKFKQNFMRTFMQRLHKPAAR